MRIVKLIVISAVVLFFLITALSLLLPSHVRISRAININAPKENIFPFISDVKEWNKWNRFLQIADSMHELKELSSSTVQAGNLHITIEKIQADSVESSWIQNKNKSGSNIVCIPGNGYTVVQWYFDFHSDWYPWQKFQSIVYDQKLGPEMEKSLETLKRLSEAH